MEEGSCALDNEMGCSGKRAWKYSKVDLKVFRQRLQLIETLMWSTEQCFARLRFCSTISILLRVSFRKSQAIVDYY